MVPGPYKEVRAGTGLHSLPRLLSLRKKDFKSLAAPSPLVSQAIMPAGGPRPFSDCVFSCRSVGGPLPRTSSEKSLRILSTSGLLALDSLFLENPFFHMVQNGSHHCWFPFYAVRPMDFKSLMETLDTQENPQSFFHSVTTRFYS